MKTDSIKRLSEHGSAPLSKKDFAKMRLAAEQEEDPAALAELGASIREAFQRLAYLTLKDERALLLEWATGFGKTRPVVEFIRDTKGHWLIVHDKLVHRRNIEKEAAKWGVSLDHCDFVTYRSLHKWEGRTVDGIVLDEAHHITERSLSSLSSILFTYIAMLSAQVPTDKRFLLRRLCSYKRLQLSLKQAMDWGALPRINILLVPVQVNSGTVYTYYKEIKKERPWIDTTYYAYSTCPMHQQNAPNQRITCTASEYLSLLEEDMEYWKGRYMKTREEWIKKVKWLPLGSKRKAFLSSLKEDTARGVITQLEESGKRYVIFADSIAQLGRVGRPEHYIHSKKTQEGNELVIEEFNSGKSHALMAVGMLNESMNLADMDVAAIISTAGVRIPNIQRVGRTTRSKRPIIIILYVPGTRDEQNVESFTEELLDYIRIVDLNELKSAI